MPLLVLCDICYGNIMKTKYRTLFISDVHLGTKLSHTEKLLEFLKAVKAEKIYLVGDIIDICALKRKFYWDSEINAVIRRLFKMVKNDVRIIYIPGNHDFYIRDFAGMDFSGIRIKKSDTHFTADGRRLLVIHGDEFDGLLSEKLLILYSIGDRFYDLAVMLSLLINKIFCLFGKQWSLSYYLKTKVKNVMAFINSFEKLLVHKARSCHVDGIVSGHIHTAELKMIDGILYANCGCWTEACTALAENANGSLEIINIDPDSPIHLEKPQKKSRRKK